MLSCADVTSPRQTYRGRIAPSPTGLLHLGHARTFWIAHRRARAEAGCLVMRIDDLDRDRCRNEYTTAAFEDLNWLGLGWDEGPDRGGPHAPYVQSERFDRYREALHTLHQRGLIFPCTRSRRDVLSAAGAPHEAHGEQDEPLYPVSFRPLADAPLPALQEKISVNWRFRVPDQTAISFHDAGLGEQRAIAGTHFGDFLVWRKDDTPSYQLACVVDDAAMGMTEVVRGADLVTSTYRQILLYRALGLTAPAFYHCPLMLDERGLRLAKRHDALSLRALRERGVDPSQLVQSFERDFPSP